MKTALSLILITLFTLPSYVVLAEGDRFVIGIDEARVNSGSSLDGTTAYMLIINYTEDKPITLTRVTSDLAGNVRLHHADKPAPSLENGGEYGHSVTIQPGSAEELSAEGYYIHLENLTAPITEGQRIPLLLTFAHGDSYLVDAVAVTPGTHLHGNDSEGYTTHNDH